LLGSAITTLMAVTVFPRSIDADSKGFSLDLAIGLRSRHVIVDYNRCSRTKEARGWGQVLRRGG